MDKSEAIKNSKYIEIYNLYHDKKYNQVIKCVTKYLEKYKDSQKVIYFRGCSYRKLKEYNKAINDLKHNIDLIEISEDYYLAYKTYIELYFIYYHLNMYEQAYELVNKIKRFEIKLDYVELKEFETAEIIIIYKLGMDQPLQNKSRYLVKQLYDYNEEEVLKHIKQHHCGDIKTKTCFLDKINIDYLYYYLKENLNNYKKIDINMGLDVYLFSIANIGIDYETNSACNVLKVLVIPQTNKIITMYPSNNKLYLSEELNIDYDKLFNKNKEKVKTISQIDKFNKRYSR